MGATKAGSAKSARRSLVQQIAKEEFATQLMVTVTSDVKMVTLARIAMQFAIRVAKTITATLKATAHMVAKTDTSGMDAVTKHAHTSAKVTFVMQTAFVLRAANLALLVKDAHTLVRKPAKDKCATKSEIA